MSNIIENFVDDTMKLFGHMAPNVYDHITEMPQQLPDNYKEFMKVTGACLSGSRGMAIRYTEDLIIEKLQSDEYDIPTVPPKEVRLLLEKCVDSDWDIVVQNNTENIEAYNYYINPNGPATTQRYADSNTTHIGSDTFRSFSNNQYKNNRADFIFKEDLIKYTTLLNQVTTRFYATHLWKKSEKYVNMDSACIRGHILDHFDMLYTMLETKYER